MWRRMKDIFSYPDFITIDPRTANPFLIVSEDRTSLQFSLLPKNVSDNLEQFAINSYCAALGSKGFISGRRYWEVKVGNKEEWMLGVIRESVDRKSMPYVTNKNGFYVIRREKERICIPFITNLPFPVNLSKIGVYLDYEGGQVAFYNTDDLSHIHTYTYTFTEKMYPYFDVWWNSNRNTPEPLKLITPNN
ncbi:E3 ubiquitin-protein ligase TRIM69-like [Latimeria chalumnae]|uniref:E3 ubiquitin-protein ligase TRIM69-like n=1 Tax=Latimeria chalumnae TaxID=7897 RepID=UPI00313CE218